MTLKQIIEVANSEVVFAILFIGFLWIAGVQTKRYIDEQKLKQQEREDYITLMHKQREDDLKALLREQRDDSVVLMREQRDESQKREREMMVYLGKITDKQVDITDTLKDIRTSLGKLEDRMETNFMEVWKELGAKQNRGNE